MPHETSAKDKENKRVVSKKPRAKAAAKKPPTKRAAVKKTTKPRATKKTAAQTGIKEPKATPRRRVAKKKTEPKSESEEKAITETVSSTKSARTSESTRRSPTAFSQEKDVRRAKRTQYIVVGVLFVVGVAASAAVGVTDAGQIDVAQTIKERNERMSNMVDVDGPITVAPVPKSLPDGGLIGLQPSTAPTPPPKMANELNAASSSASSTPAVQAVASSTDSVVTASSSASSTETVASQPPVSPTVTATTTVEATSTQESAS